MGTKQSKPLETTNTDPQRISLNAPQSMMLQTRASIIPINSNEFLITAPMQNDYHGRNKEKVIPGIYIYNSDNNEYSILSPYPKSLPNASYTDIKEIAYDNKQNKLYMCYITFEGIPGPGSIYIIPFDMNTRQFDFESMSLFPTHIDEFADHMLSTGDEIHLFTSTLQFPNSIPIKYRHVIYNKHTKSISELDITSKVSQQRRWTYFAFYISSKNAILLITYLKHDLYRLNQYLY